MSTANSKKKSLYALTKPALIKKLKQHRLPTHGTKKDMIARLMTVENKKKKKKKKENSELLQSTTSFVSIDDEKQNIITIGDRVQLRNNMFGSVAFIGNIKNKNGIFYGIILDKSKGKNNGSINNILYFKCKPKTGMFVSKADIIKINTQNNKTAPRVEIGDKIKCIKANSNGTIKFIGTPYSIKQSGIYYGIALDKPNGKNNGILNGRQYFKCKNKHGIFVKANGITAPDNVYEESISKQVLNVMTWNIAGINNNPWEYYVSIDDKKYKILMDNIEHFLTTKGKHIKVSYILNQIDKDFFGKIDKLIQDNEILSDELKDNDEVIIDFDSIFKNDVNKYLDISVCEFLSNKFIGEYRLISWPDRLLNTIDNDSKTGENYIYRPTPINYSSEIYETVTDWFITWLEFMNNIGIDVLKQHRDNKYAKKYAKFGKFGNNKIFLTLNIILLAIFDGILIHLLFDIESKTNISWQNVKRLMYNIFNKNKLHNTVNILNDMYNKCDIIFLQEVRNNFLDCVADENALKQNYHIIFPQKVSKNNQTSIICLKKKIFDVGQIEEITDLFYDEYNGKIDISFGDLIVVKIEDLKYILISFHGDTGGLATPDLLITINKIIMEKQWNEEYKLMIGIDGNTYYDQTVTEKKKKYSLKNFIQLIQTLNMNHCFDCGNDGPTKHTTNHPRTYLQPQLNKAVKREDIKKKYVDFRSPKDFIIFYENQFELIENSTIIDNTGSKEYNDDVEYILPSQYLPSDHAIISASFKTN